MTRTRRSAGGVANTGAEIDPPELYQWRSLLVTFLKEASASLGYSYFWLVRTNGWKSLCLLTGLTPLDYGILLHQCKLVYIVDMHDGSRQVKLDRKEFEQFLKVYGLRGDPKLRDSCAELSEARITPLALKRNVRGSKRDKSAATDIMGDEESNSKMHVLRVGKIPRGATPPKSTAINNGNETPRINRRMYNAKNNLAESLRKKLLLHYLDPELLNDAKLVRDWVLIKKSSPAAVVPTPQQTTTPSSNTNTNNDGNNKQPLPSPGDTDGPDSPDTTIDTPARPDAKRANTAPRTPSTISNLKQSSGLESSVDVDPKSKGCAPDIDVTLEIDMINFPEVVRKEFPMLTSTDTPDKFDTWDEQKKAMFWHEYEVLKTRFNQPDVPEDVRKQFPCLTKMAPGITDRGNRVVNGIDLDKQWMEGMLKESVAVAAQHNEPLQFTHANGKHAVRLIKLPMSKANDGKVKPNIKKCMDELLDVVGHEHEDEVVDILLEYLISNHKEKTMDTLREKSMIPKVMDEFDVAALLDQSGIKIWQWRSIQQCLKLFMDIKQIGVSEEKLRALGADHGEIKHGTYHYTDPSNPDKVKEEVRYWYKDVVFEFIQAVEGLINGYELDPTLIEFIHIAHGGDHGKEKFRFASKLVLKMKDGTYYDDVFGLADVACKKDHAIILDNTVLPPLMKGINIIEDSDLVFNNITSADGTSTLSIDMAKSNKHVSAMSIKPTSFMVGDLAFLSVMMGKPNFSGTWCCWCKLTKDDWQNPCADVDADQLWDITGVVEQALLNEQNGFGVTDKSDPRMRGVRNAPKSKIAFERHIFSALHAGIGIGNRLVKVLETFIDIDIEHITPEEFQLRNERDAAGDSLTLQRTLKGVWMNSHEGGKAIPRKRNRVKTLDRQLKTNITAAEKREKNEEKRQLGIDITILVKKRDKYSKEISRLEKVVKDTKEKLEQFTKDRRGAEESIYTKVDRIFQSIGANRAHYFGRKFEGVDLRKIMAKSDELFGEDGKIRKLLLEHASDDTTKEEAKKVCENVGLAFKLWDGVFSHVHKVDPTNEHCDETQDRINKAMAHMRAMGIPITPKMHGMEAHVVRQMRDIPGGIAKLVEHWVEQYHQIGYRYDVSYCRAGTLHNQANIRSVVEKRARHPKVKMAINRLKKKYKGSRKRKEKQILKAEMKVRIKLERRSKAFEEVAVKLEKLEMEKADDISNALRNEEELDDIAELLELENSIHADTNAVRRSNRERRAPANRHLDDSDSDDES